MSLVFLLRLAINEVIVLRYIEVVTWAVEVLGTDGYGLSETVELRAHFEINADYIAQASLAALLDRK